MDDLKKSSMRKTYCDRNEIHIKSADGRNKLKRIDKKVFSDWENIYHYDPYDEWRESQIDELNLLNHILLEDTCNCDEMRCGCFYEMI